MKSKNMRILLAAGILMITAIFAGCGGTNEQTTPPITMQPVPSEEAYKAKCEGCHLTDEMKAKVTGFSNSSHGTWTDALNRMKSIYGVNMTNDEFNTVRNYLIHKDNMASGVCP